MKALFANPIKALALAACNAAYGMFEHGELDDSGEVVFDGITFFGFDVILDGREYTIEATDDGGYIVTDQDENTITYDEETGVITVTDIDGAIVKTIDAQGNEVEGDAETAEPFVDVVEGYEADDENETAAA